MFSKRLQKNLPSLNLKENVGNVVTVITEKVSGG